MLNNNIGNLYTGDNYDNKKRIHLNINEIYDLNFGDLIYIIVIDASPDTLKYELEVSAASKTKSFGTVQLRKCLNASGEIRTAPPCWWTAGGPR